MKYELQQNVHVVLKQNVITLMQKVYDKIFNGKRNNLSTQNVITFLTHNVNLYR